MITSLRYILPTALVASCSHGFNPDEINTHPPLWFEYTLLSMKGHEGALRRDKDILGASKLEDTTLKVLDYWSGEKEWHELNIGNCVRYQNQPEGPFEMLHRCTELIDVDGIKKEYVPYIMAGENFVQKIAPRIAEIKNPKDSDGAILADYIILVDEKNKELGRFKYKGPTK